MTNKQWFLLLVLFAGLSMAEMETGLAQNARPAPGPPPPISVYEQQKRKANENVVTITASGRLTGYTQFAEDISNIFDDMSDAKVRVITLIGKGAGQNVHDMLFLKSIDMGVVDQDILIYLKRKNPALYGEVDQRIQYITKLFNTSLHLYAKNEINSLEDLRGKKVSCLKPMSTVAILCENLFHALRIPVQIVHDDAALAMQKVKTGEIAAAARGGLPPIQGFETVKPEDNLHFVPIEEKTPRNSDFSAIRATYLPARLKSAHYATMIPEGAEVPTIATSTLLVAYAWPADSDRSKYVASFVKAFFENIDKFNKPPRHAGWADVNLAAEVPGWKRLPAAQEMIDKMRLSQAKPAEATGSNPTIVVDEKAKTAFVAFVNQYAKSRDATAPLTETDKAALWVQFQRWWADRAGR